MPLGLSGKFNVLARSPHDLEPEEPEPIDAPESGAIHWVPSRYNIRAVTADGRLVVWNTFRGTLSIFEPPQRPAIERILRRGGVLARGEGAILYLFERGFLLKEGTDEFRRIRLEFGRQHYRNDVLQFILMASEDCNFRCEYCYEDFARGTMKPWVREGIKKLVEKRLDTIKFLSVSWFGGEPLYGWEAIEDLGPYFVETAEKHSIHFSGQMTTNGYLLTPEVAEKLLAWKVRSFQITLDGAPQDHDRNRPGRDGSGTFSTIFENLRALRDRPEPFAVDLRVNFDPKNIPGMPELLDLVAREFQDDRRFRLRFRAVGKWGGANDDQISVCTDDEAGRWQFALKDEARKRGIALSDDIREIQGFGGQACYAARPYNFIIGATGKVMKCTIDLDKQDRNDVGKLTADGDLQLDLDKFAVWTDPAFESDAKCQKCVVVPICQGLYCPIVRWDEGRSPCTSLRMEAKHEIRAMAEEAPRKRVTVVNGQGVERRVAPPPSA
ncbi:MAG TPA: radical SAM protein [Thermoanaerobaculia bacterium]|nr:radical SAM protein [Thermoanaerobaculia bacterium]